MCTCSSGHLAPSCGAAAAAGKKTHDEICVTKMLLETREKLQKHLVLWTFMSKFYSYTDSEILCVPWYTTAAQLVILHSPVKCLTQSDFPMIFFAS